LQTVSKKNCGFVGFLKQVLASIGISTFKFSAAPIFAASVAEGEFATVLLEIVVVSFSLGLGLGYLMRKTGSILGSSLCEAGSVIPIFLIAISSLK
jgi:hypothetical protein